MSAGKNTSHIGRHFLNDGGSDTGPICLSPSKLKADTKSGLEIASRAYKMVKGEVWVLSFIR